MKMTLIYTLLKKHVCRLLLICLLATLSLFEAKGQTVSLRDGGFELFGQCPTDISAVNFEQVPNGFTRWLINWFNPIRSTPDYFNCGFLPWHNFSANQVLPHSGNGLIGLAVASKINSAPNNWREYVSQKLSTPLVAGVKYGISFYMRKCDPGTTINELGEAEIIADMPAAERGFFGVCFGTTAPPTLGQVLVIPDSYAPTGRVYVPASDPAYVNNFWTQVTLQYTATGGEQYITIGQFLEAPSLIVGPDPLCWAYYFVDDINLGGACNAGTAQVALNGSSLSNTCPLNTANLNTLFTGAAPTNSSLVWFNNASHTGTAYATPATAGAGTYFAFFYDAVNDCYNTAASTASVTVTINNCGVCPSTAPVLSATSAIICPGSGGAVNLNNFVSSTTPAGAALVWKDGSGTTISNTTAVSTAGVYTATYFNASLNCSSPASAGITLAFLPNPVPTASTINICSPATTANLTNVVTAPNGSGYVIEWYDGVNFNLQTPAQLAAEPPGDYYVYFRSGATCYNNADIMVTVTNNAAGCTVCPTAPTLSAVTQPTCTVATGSFTITNFNSSFTYTVNPSAGVTVTGSSITAPAGSYTVTASSGACTPAVSASVTVNTQPATPAAPATGTVTQPVCPVTTGSVALSGLPSSGSWTITITPAVATATGVSSSGTTTTIANLPAGTYTFKVTNSTGCVSASSSSVVINNVNCTVAGIIDCSKTMLTPAPVFGTASQLDLVVTVNVTTAGCFTPITVSGSGFTLATGITQICAINTGIQQLHIPVNYDGTTLGTLSFTIGQAGACNADLTKPPKQKEINIWTLDNCTLKNTAPGVK